MPLDPSDLADSGVVTESELISDAASAYRSADTVTGVTAGVVSVTSTVGPLINYDLPVQSGDIAVISGNVAAGTYTVDTVDLNSFTVVEAISDAGAGTVDFRYKSGSKMVGVDPSNLTQSIQNNLQGVLEDLDSSISAGGLTASQHKALRDLIHFIDDGPADGFTSGAYLEVTYSGVLPTVETWYEDNTKTQKIVELTTVYSGVLPSTETWVMYDTDGTTVLVTLVDTITYSGVLESSRDRTWS